MKLYYNWIRGSNTGVSYVIGNEYSGTFSIETFDEFGRSTSSSFVDKASPSLIYYDIDMTRGDRGTFGGPNSIDNYFNTATGKARVYDLNMPFEIWSGSTPQVRAKAAHTK